MALKKIVLQIMLKIAQKFSYLTQTLCLKFVNVHVGGNFYLYYLFCNAVLTIGKLRGIDNKTIIGYLIANCVK